MTAVSALLIGCGRIGAHTADRLRESLPSVWFPYSHLDAALEIDDIEVVGVCDQDADAAKSTAEEFSIPRSFTDPVEAIADTSPDLVMVATRMAGRADILSAAIRHGAKGLHFEKPLAGTAGECRAVMDLAAANGVAVSYGAVRRYMDIPRFVRSQIGAEPVGALRHISVESGLGELFWAHPHNFDLITFFAGVGPVESVQSNLVYKQSDWREPTLDADPKVRSCAIEFADGVTASISSTGTSLLRLHCERAEFVVGGNTSWLQRTARAAGDLTPPSPQIVDVDVTMSGRRRALTELVHAIRGGPADCHSPEDVVRSNELGMACAWSAVNGGRAVTLEDVPAHFEVTGRQGDLYA